MKSSKKLQILSHLLFVYINNQNRKWRMYVSTCVFLCSIDTIELASILLPSTVTSVLISFCTTTTS